MIRLVKSMSLVFLLIATAALPAISEESKTVTAEGVAAIQGNARDIARDAALEDAQKRAVEQAIGILIDSQTQVENYQLISDKILSQTKGYIKRYNVISETVDSGLLRVRINAEVALGRLTDDLSGIGILLGRMHKPRTMVMIAEQNIGQTVIAWWLGAYGEQTDISVVENVFMDKFTEKGFEFIDHQIAVKEIKVTEAYRVKDLTVAQAKTLGAQADAEVVIIGKAVSKRFGEIGGGMISAQADLSARAVRIDTGQVIATASTHAAAVHVSDVTAGTEALKKAANEAAEEMMGKILTIYAKETGGTRSVNITITGLNKNQFAKFKDVLQNQVRGIKDLHERSFNGTTAKISVDSKNSAQILSDELLLRDFSGFSVEVVSSTANSLELKVTPK
ncbi:MAG: flagellar assembly protein T N-terminal domain-containing protein [Nitrospirae bacterium]|nr:flagellar assembly protein T N-terminal domain-containing protein [Nitrospirota bacterium]